MGDPAEIAAHVEAIVAATEQMIAAEVPGFGAALGKCLPFRRIAEVLADQGCNRIEVEYPYYCRDFTSEYAFLYSRTLESIDPWTARLHFFRGQEDGSETYLGFSVVRPLERYCYDECQPAARYTLSRIGRTVLSFDGPNHYVRCRGDYRAHLGGRELAVTGAPFIQQDTQVMCCAHAAMWVANRLLSQRQSAIRDYYPHEIARMSTESVTRGPTLPTTGLYVDQMLYCIQEMGFEPLYYDYEFASDVDFEFADGTLYRYVESGIPAILLLPEHAVCVIGHTFQPEESPNPSSTEYLTPTTWIPHFIVQDDASGPYRLMPNKATDIGKEPHGEFGFCLKDRARGVQGVIVPLPRNILISGEAAETRAWNVLTRDAEVSKALADAAASATGEQLGLQRALDEHALVLRTYLEESTSFKARMAKLAAAPHASDSLKTLADVYCTAFLSRYIWVTELSTPRLFGASRKKERRMIGEILLDTTSSELGKPEFAVHIPGALFINDTRSPYDVEKIPLPDDAAYQHQLTV